MVSASKEHNVVTIIKNIDKASPCLAMHLAQNDGLLQMQLRFLRESQENPGQYEEYYVIRLQDVLVVHFRQIMRHRGNGEFVHLDEVSFAYGQIEMEWLEPGGDIWTEQCFGE
jgi:type VI secretion system Hcp family effector